MEERNRINSFSARLAHKKRNIDNLLLYEDLFSLLKNPVTLVRNILYRGKLSYIINRFERMREENNREAVYRSYLAPDLSYLTTADTTKKFIKSLEKSAKGQEKIMKFIEKNNNL